jgi:hypothetical protein
MRVLIPIALGSLLVWSSAVRAQDLNPAERRAAAEAAYDRGTRAYRGGDYAQAARWYETANELAPAAAALLQAIRAHGRAGNTLRAATLVSHVVSEYGEERARRSMRHLEEAEREGFKVTVSCTDCTLELDGESEVFRTFYLAPDVSHTLVGVFEGGRTEREVRGAAGTSTEVALEPPPPPEPVVVEGPPRVIEVPAEDGGISPAFFITGLVLTAAAGGFAIWSWLDTLAAADVYEMDIRDNGPTDRARAMLDEGRDLELRTTIIDIGTAVLGAATILLLVFTDWDGEDEREDEGAPAGESEIAFGSRTPLAWYPTLGGEL